MEFTNKKLKKIKLNKKIVVISVIILLLVIACIFQYNRNKEQDKINEIKNYTNMNDFKTIEEVCIYMDCEYIKQEKSKTEGYSQDIYMQIKYSPVENNIINQSYYERLMMYCAKVLNYENYIIIDKSKDLVIAVICDKENQVITNYYINNEQNYFEKYESNQEITKFSEIEITNLDVQSTLIKSLINNNWKIDASKIGTAESSYNGYDIFFDEGVELQKKAGKVFNIIFTVAYKENVVNNLNTNSTKEQIIQVLGTPTFSDDNCNLIGYKGEKMYIFFDYANNQISIYRIESSYKTDEIAQYIDTFNNDGDLTKFITSVKNTWNDYDIYNYDSDYVELQYTLKGISFKFNVNNKAGIYVYQNYKGKVSSNITIDSAISGTSTLPDNVYAISSDLVYEKEKSRISEIINKTAEYFTYSNIIGKSSKAILIEKSVNSKSYKVEIISKDKDFANCELRESINYGIWLDDYNFIYSVSNKGIYIYNICTQEYKTLISGNTEEFKLTSIENNVLKYDEKSAQIK